MLLEKSLRVVQNQPDCGRLVESDVLIQLAQFRISCREYAKAEDVLHRALKILDSAQGADSGRTATVLNTLVQVYRKTGNTAEIAKLERRLEEIHVRKQVAYVPLAAAIQ
jgi:hypothetical protein